MNPHEDPNIHLQADDDLYEEHSPACRCSLCHPERLHPPDLELVRIRTAHFCYELVQPT